MIPLPQIQLGPGSSTALGPLLDQLKADTLFIVADPHAYEASGARAALSPALATRRTVFFDRFDPTPTLGDVEAALSIFQQAPAAVLIAVGGGTAIDIAKLVRACCVHSASPHALCSGQAPIQTAGPPLIAIPTTAGTGSESTHFAVVYIGTEKYSVAHPSVLPDYALLDPALHASMPPGLTAHTGLDAFCQAAESLWSVHSTPTSQALASQALHLSNTHLQTAVLAPTPAARLGMCHAANLAGQAINISKTTAPHALSYALTAHHHVPHGLAVALTLGAILVYNSQVQAADCNDPRGPDHVHKTIKQLGDLLGCQTPTATQDHLRQLMQTLGCPTRLSEVGVRTTADIEFLAAQVNIQRLDNNPRRFTQEALVKLLQILV